ncbi:putative ATP-dependent endonuclease of OLD family [Orbus hercynius]|uniref:Putative ATP-dependent endonuclease of OLD family n=1 Tax=Orbus hercynius TaxID=593135 RepID=A0A495RIC6_9GAMM|nr:DUF2813 domain-containing protein [Orbus hercynius]RKS87161.1 putative ATP-dependent endonuclease of OLD family [Orbus hercynius]
MYLTRIDIDNFKGIKHLELELNHKSSVLIGENRWGRSSLISALTLLSQSHLYYQFTNDDFFDEQGAAIHSACLRFTFCESNPNELKQQHYLPLNSAAYFDATLDRWVIRYQIQASRRNEQMVTEHYFIDANGHRLNLDNDKALIELLIMLNPVMRLKNPLNDKELPLTNTPLSSYYINELSTQLAAHSQQFSPADLEHGLVAAKALLEYYLVDRNRRYHYKHIAKKPTPTHEEWNSLERINDQLDRLDNDYIRIILMGVFSALLTARGNDHLSPHTMPILVLEEPEGQLHPIILAVGFRLLKHFPTQKIITTNSSDLVSLFSLEHIYRLIRSPSGIVAWHTGVNGLSVSDSRRILFHVLYRRASAIFARSWLLVEGETEVWLLRELAEQSGFHLNSDGVQLIEFAQCGLKPLIKYANKMGIQWHVLTDGDTAGKKYADTVNSLCPVEGNINNYLTVLPARDIENFLFKNGFSHVYKMASYGTSEHIDLPIHRIIQKAIQKSSKPDLAIAVCDDAKTRGASVIPSLFKDTFSLVVKLAKTSH